MRSVSFTKLHPTNFIASFERGVVNLAPKLRVCMIIESKGELMRVHIVGLAPLPYPDP